MGPGDPGPQRRDAGARPAGDTFPSDGRELGAVGRYLGYESGHVGEMVDDYRRITRRARAVVEERFYGA